MSESSNSSSGIGFTGLLLIVLITLKLLGKISWGSWWVLSPAWMAAGLVALLLGIYGLLVLVQARMEKRK